MNGRDILETSGYLPFIARHSNGNHGLRVWTPELLVHLPLTCGDLVKSFHLAGCQAFVCKRMKWNEVSFS